MQTVLATLYIVIAQLSAVVSPVMPEATSKLLDVMGIGEEHCEQQNPIRSHWYSPLAESGFALEKPVGIFPRLELPEGVEV